MAPSGSPRNERALPEVLALADRVEAFVRNVVAPYEQDPRRDHHGAPTDALVHELRDKAREAGVLTRISAPMAAISPSAKRRRC
jgi:hypothetical protein